MSYIITARIYQTNPNAFFQPIESTVWNYANGGTWSLVDGAHVLTMGGSGTSGILRFESDTGERFSVALGVHNNARWCDIVTGLAAKDTAVAIHPEYYNNGKRAYTREKTLKEYSVKSSAGRNFQVKYAVAEGNKLVANIIIG